MKDAIMNGSILQEIKRFDKLSQLKHLLAYVDALRIIQDLSNVKVQSDNSIKRQSFWDMESDWEKRLYNKMKSCEARHPILGIIICTI